MHHLLQRLADAVGWDGPVVDIVILILFVLAILGSLFFAIIEHAVVRSGAS